MVRVSPAQLLLLPLLLIALLFPSDVAAQNSLTQTYTAPDGSFSFSYPESWSLVYDDKGGVNLIEGDKAYVLMFFPNQTQDKAFDVPLSQVTPMEMALSDQDFWKLGRGGKVLEPEAVTLGPYPCVRFNVQEPDQDRADSVEYVLDTGDTLTTVMGVPLSGGHFQEHQVVVEAIIASIRVPAGASAPVQNPENVVPVERQTTVTREQIAADTGLNFSVRLPSGWQFRTLTDLELYSSALVFGETSEIVQSAAANLKTDARLPIRGPYGGIGIVRPALWTRMADDPDTAVQLLMSAAAVDLTVVGAANLPVMGRYVDCLEVTISGVNTRGFVGGFNADGEVVLFSLMAGPGGSFETYRPMLTAMAATIHMPAEAGAVTEPVVAVVPTPPPPTLVLVPTQLPPPTLALTPVVEQAALGELLDLGNHTLSLRLPAGWGWIDRTADQGILVFGDREDARLSRLGAIRPDLQPQAPAITGTGGVVALYPLTALGLTPATLDLNALMTQVLDGLKASGYTVETPPQAVQLEQHSGLVAIVRGAEYGYLALVPFDNTVAYVTGTGTPDTFAAHQAILLQVIESLHVPALSAAPKAGTRGLGGLHVEPTATPAGLPGLGGHAVGRETPVVEPTP